MEADEPDAATADEPDAAAAAEGADTPAAAEGPSLIVRWCALTDNDSVASIAVLADDEELGRATGEATELRLTPTPSARSLVVEACDPSDNNPACTLPDLDTNNPITHLITAADHPDFTLTSTSNQITFESQRGTTSGATLNVESRDDEAFEVTINVGLLGQVGICSVDTDPNTEYVSGYRAC